jgi:hypothetical protein
MEQGFNAMLGIKETKLERAIRIVTGLLAKAEHPNTNAEEADAFRTKAEDMMKQYRIDEQNLIAEDQFSITPVYREIVICSYFEPDSAILFDFTTNYYTMFIAVCNHTGLRCALEYKKIDGRYQLVGQVVGYESDIRYAELIWMNIRMTFIARVDVRVDRSLSDEENIYRMRSAGVVRKDVAEALWGKWTHSNSARVAKIYEAECERRGEVPAVSGKGVSKKLFREIFAERFMWRIYDRLKRMSDGVMGTAGTLDIAGRQEKVEAAFYEKFPEQKPKPINTEPLTDEASKARAQIAKPRKVTQAMRREWDRRENSSAALAGRSAGEAAADSVVFTRSADRTERVSSGPAQSTTPDGGALPAIEG